MEKGDVGLKVVMIEKAWALTAVFVVSAVIIVSAHRIFLSPIHPTAYGQLKICGLSPYL